VKIERSLLNRKRARPSLWLALMALLALAGALRPPSAHAANITVAAGEVAISSNGICSLREAIINANDDAATHADCTAGSGADILTLAAGAYNVADSYASYNGNTGLPQITSPITIEGNGATIDRSGAAVYRLFALNSTGNLTLNDLMLTDGAMTTDVGGGAIYNNGGTLTINDSFLSGHSATNSQGGGAIRSNGGTVTINTSTLSGNQSGNSGGGGAIYATNSATLTINDSTLGGNSATNTNGGAISIGSGSGSVTLNRSTVGANNTANGGAGIASSGGTLTLNNSTISGNQAQSAGGGGIYNNGATVTLNNSTVTGNTTTTGGGGILSNSGTLNLNRSIVSGNTGNTGYDSGYEVVSYGTENANNYNVFGRDGISNNRAFAYSFTPGANDFNATDDGGNVAIGSILNTTLANNGGPTSTHALVAGSPAVDRAPSAACTAAPISGLDQRSYPRNVDGNATAGANECDAGSFEYLSSPPPTTGDIVIVKDATPADNTPFDFTENIPGAASGFTLTDPADNTETFDDVAAGSYTVTETGEADWTLDSIVCVDPDNGSTTAGATATIDLDAGETVTCTFSNSRDTGTITIVKEATPADNTPFDFTETIPGPGTGFTLTDPADNSETFSNVPTGSYSVTESAVAGWALDGIVCVDPDNGSTTAGATATIDLDDGETVTCTFSNTKLAADIYVSANDAGIAAGNVPFGPHDILAWDGSAWSIWFDGSAAGLMPVGPNKHDINALWIPDPAEEEVVLSFVQNARFVDGISGKVNGMDLVWWDGDAFSLWFDGEDVGLTNMTQEKIDALHVLDGSLAPPALAASAGGSCDAYLLISTAGDGQVPNYSGGTIKFDGTDVLGFCLTQSGATTQGKWTRVLNGKAEGMPGQALVNLSASDDGQVLYLTTRATFNVDTAQGGHSMIYRYDFSTGQFSGPFFSAPANGLNKAVDGLHVDGDLP
jgi:hypothetical protein